MALRRQMEHAVENLFLEDAVERAEMREIAVDEVKLGVHVVRDDVADVLLAPVRLAHQAEHLMAIANDKIGQVRPGKPGNARNQILHAPTSRPVELTGARLCAIPPAITSRRFAP